MMFSVVHTELIGDNNGDDIEPCTPAAAPIHISGDSRQFKTRYDSI